MKPDSAANDDSEDFLAPPEFGSFDEGSSDMMLPVATSMEELLDADEESGPSAAALAAAQYAESEGVGERAPPTAAELEAKGAKPKPEVAEIDEAERVSATEDSFNGAKTRTPMILGAAVIILLGIGIAVMFAGSDEQATPASAARSAENESGRAASEQTPTNDAPLSPTSPKPSPARSDGDDSRTLPTDLEALRAMTFTKRHELLTVAAGEVDVADHIALDLVQAKDAPEPCRTFSDALSTIESADDTAPFAWAIEEAAVPDPDDPACEGLSGRLSRLKALDAPPARRAPNRSARRRRPSSSSRGAADPASRKPEPPPAEPNSGPVDAESDSGEPAESVKPPEPVKPDPKRKPSVATRLDDSGLKELD